MHISTAGNVEVPAYLAVLAKGYAVDRLPQSRFLRATNGEHTFVADNWIELLGLVAMIEVRGEQWRASNEEIDDFIERVT